MNILRWLMKHPIMLAWLLAIVAILLNFGMSDKSGKHGQEMAAGQEATQAHGQEAAQAHGQAATQNAQADGGAVGAPAQAAPAVGAHAQAGADVGQAGQQANVAAPVQANNVAGVQQQQGADAGVAQQPVAGTAADQTADLLRAAREAYWSNELDNAVEFYATLVKQSPDSLEYKGELANVYWKQGNAKQAAALFTEIAPKLAAQGRVTEAFNMKLYVDMVDPELAKQIDAALSK